MRQSLGSIILITDRMNQKPFTTPQAKELYDELVKIGVRAISEFSDLHKHVDIGIPDAKLYIEVDGLQHLQILIKSLKTLDVNTTQTSMVFRQFTFQISL